jgi:hypothetical protein
MKWKRAGECFESRLKISMFEQNCKGWSRSAIGGLGTGSLPNNGRSTVAHFS